MVEHLGSDLFAHLAIPGLPERIIARLDGMQELRPGAPVGLSFLEEHLHRFDDEGRRMAERIPGSPHPELVEGSRTSAMPERSTSTLRQAQGEVE